MGTFNKKLPEQEILEKVTGATVAFADELGKHLAQGNDREGNVALTTSQLRKFFGEVKRQQMRGYNESDFVMLKPKLAYAVGRARKNTKLHYNIEDFYNVISHAIDIVEKSSDKKKSFKNFITVFEAIVAYHKKYENERI